MLKAQNFGVEVEAYNITRKQAATAIATHFNTTAKYMGGSYDAWEITDSRERTWQIVSDASIRDIPERRVELVTPILGYRDNGISAHTAYANGTATDAEIIAAFDRDMNTLQEVVRALRKAGSRSDADHCCGIHIHCDGTGHTPQTLRNLINLTAAKEDLIAKALNINPVRQANYCKKVDKTFLEQLNKKKPKTMAEFQRLWYGGRDESHIKYSSKRYFCTNCHSFFRQHTTEWRAANGTTHTGEIRTMVLFFLALNDYAKKAKSTSPIAKPVKNEKFELRVFLLKIGFIGAEYKNPRMHMMKHLTGDSAFSRPRRVA